MLSNNEKKYLMKKIPKNNYVNTIKIIIVQVMFFLLLC